MKASEIAYEKIRKMIVTTELEPGQEIDMNQLMKQLELGRTPIREALNRLSHESFVRILARKGMIVADLNIHDMEKLRELRLYFVKYLSNQIIKNSGKKEIELIKEKLDKLKTIESNFMNSLLADIEFHELTYELCDNKFAEEQMKKNLYLSVRSMVKGKILGVSLETLAENYRQLIEFIKKEDAFGLERMLLSHILE